MGLVAAPGRQVLALCLASALWILFLIGLILGDFGGGDFAKCL